MMVFALCLCPKGAVRAELPASLDTYQKITKTLFAPGRGQGLPWWSWKAGGGAAQLAAFCRLHGFSRVIVPIGSVQENWDLSFSKYELPYVNELASLAHTLRGSGIEPVAGFFVATSMNDLDNWEYAGDVLSALHVFNVTYVTSRFEGLVVLQVPTAPDEEYLLMNERLEAKNGQLSAGLLVAAFISPSWMVMESLYGAPNAMGEALSGLQEGILFSAEPRTVSDVALSREALSYAGAAGAVMSVSIDVSPSSGDDVFDELLLAEDKADFFGAVASYHEELRSHPHFGQIVLSDYPSLFEKLYGAPPAAYEEALSSLYGGGPEVDLLDWPSLNEEEVSGQEPQSPGDDSGSTSGDTPKVPDEEKSGSYVGQSGSSGAGLGGGPGLEPPARGSGCGCVAAGRGAGSRLLEVVISLF